MIALTILISLAWLANLAIGWVDPARSVPAVNTIFGLVAGSLFVIGQKDKAVSAIKSLQGKRTQDPQRDDGGDET
jgi:hypothetical protein